MTPTLKWMVTDVNLINTKYSQLHVHVHLNANVQEVLINRKYIVQDQWRFQKM